MIHSKTNKGAVTSMPYITGSTPTKIKWINPRENVMQEKTIHLSISKNLCYQPNAKQTDELILQYPINALLQIARSDRPILEKIYNYFDFDETDNVNHQLEVAFIRHDRLQDNYLPALFFKKIEDLEQAFIDIFDGVDLADWFTGDKMSLSHLIAQGKERIKIK